MRAARVSLFLIAAVLFAPLAFPQDQADPFLLEKVLPAETFFYLSIPNDPARGEEFKKSNLHKFANHPEIRAFVEPLENYLSGRKNKARIRPGLPEEPSWNKAVQDAIGLTIDELWELFQGPVSFAMVDLPVNPEHTIDLVLAVGAARPAALEEAISRFKKRMKEDSPGLVESEYAFKGAKIHQFGDEDFSIYHATVGKSLVIATSQARIESIVSIASGEKAKGLQEHEPFRAVRAHVAPENRHLFFGYVGLDSILRIFRKEIGDEILGILERIGVRDITALGGAMSYDLPFLRERYALATSRQDRGLVKMLAGKPAADAAARFVPAGAVEYTHINTALTEAYDLVRELSKIDAETEERVKKAVEEYEARLGLKIRDDVLASVGGSWTSYTTFPEAGGAYPDWVLVGEVRDSKKLFDSLDKIAADAKWRTDHTEFRGQKIRFYQIVFEPTGAEFDPALQPLFSFAYPVALFERDGFLFASTNPLALKRQVVRLAEGTKPIQDDPRFQEPASRFPGEPEAFHYVDFGRMFTFWYNTFEPFLHFVRDFTRDPDTGEYIIDLARLPLGETVGGLIGPAYTVKRTQKDAIVIESVSNVGLTTISSVLILSMGAALAIPVLLRRSGEPIMGPAENERLAQLTLQSIHMAQETFKNSDMDRNGVADFWTKDVAGLYALKDRSDNEIFLIDPATAAADAAGAASYDGLKARMMPKTGYWYRVVTKDPDGDAYQKDPDKDGRSWTNEKRWAVVAYPAAYGATGNNTYLVTETGAIWKKDTGGEAVDAMPADPEKDGWLREE